MVRIGPQAEVVAEKASASPAQTRKLGEALGKILRPATVLALHGDLGSGKTVFVQGLAKGLGIRNAQEIRSPTFAIIQEHDGRIPLCHADLYRLAREETRHLGLEEYWKEDSPYVCAIEWAERAEGFIPRPEKSERALDIHFEVSGKLGRRLRFTGKISWKKILAKLKS